MIRMQRMILTMIMQQSYADDLECQNERLRQQLEGLGIDPYDGAGISTAKPSDAYYNKPFRECSPWLDTYQQDDRSRGWSPWPDTRQQDD